MRVCRHDRPHAGAALSQHKDGIKANRFVQRYGLRLLPQLYAYCNPMPYQGARDMAVQILLEAGVLDAAAARQYKGVA